MKIFTLLLFIITLAACNTAKTTDVAGEPEPAATEEVSQQAEPVVSDAPAQSNIDIAAEPAIEIDPKYLITNIGAGPFTLDGVIPSKVAGYTIVKEIIQAEGGEVGVYTIYENGQKALFIGYYGGFDITVFLDKFRTSKNIGVGTTIEELVSAYPDYELWCEERESYVYCQLLSDIPELQYELMGIVFVVDRKDFLNPQKLEFAQLQVSDFNKAAKIKMIYISRN